MTLAQVADGLADVAAAFGRAERIAVGDHELSVLLIKNPAGANEILRTLALESGELDLLGVLNDRIADGRDISWVWDADFELLAGRVRRVTCAGTRAAELALRLKYAGVAARAPRRRRPPARRAGRGARAGPGRRGGVRAADLHGPARAAGRAGPPRPRRAVLRAASRRRYERGDLARPRMRRLRRGPVLLASARRQDRRPGARRRRRHRPRGPGAGPRRASRCSPSTSTTSCWRCCASAPATCRCARSSATPGRSGWATRFALCVVPMQTIQLLGGLRGARVISGVRARPSGAGGGPGDRDRRGAGLLRDRRRACPARCPT